MHTNSNKIIGLITDFGDKGSHYAAAMKAIILGINSNIPIIDITHHISSYSILEASYIIKTTYNLFPQNSIFIIVVDPGVGTSREILAVKTNSNYYFIGPNNGIFSLIFEINEVNKCIHIQNEKFFNKPVSNTFHGRDIMAPVGAYISKNIPLENFGPTFNLKNFIPYPIEYNVSLKNNTIDCIIQYIDNFGNAVTNIPIVDNKIEGTKIKFVDKMPLRFQFNRKEFEGIFKSVYIASDFNTLIFIKGSSGYLEISINQGNAAEKLSLHVGDSLRFKL